MGVTAITDFTYESVTRELKQQLNNTAQGVVYIGWLLRKARDSEIYKEKYSTMTEYGQAEFGLSQSDVSRFIAINERYSDGGNSPQLADSYAGFGSSKLVEMLTLHDEDVKAIDKDTTVSQIRELKHFEKTESAEPVPAEPVEQQFVNAFFTASAKRSSALCSEQFSKCMQILKGEQDPEYKERKIQEIVNPGRNSVFTGGSVFAFLKDRNIKIKRLGGSAYIDVSYLQFANLVRLLFPEGLPVQEPEAEVKEEKQQESEKKLEPSVSKSVAGSVDNSKKNLEKKESNPQKSLEKKENATSHKEKEQVDEKIINPPEAAEEPEVEVIKAEDVEVIELPEKKMQTDRIDRLRRKQKEALSHIGDLRKFAEKADLIGIRSELQMMQMILADWEKLQNEE